MYKLSDDEFKYISKRVYDFARINLTERKRSLIISRLSKRINKLGLSGFSEYVELLKDLTPKDEEFTKMVDALSTNFSHFFRESHHFEYLKRVVLPELQGREIKIWSAAASTGQEIFSILITLLEYQNNRGIKLNYKLYASDISREVLESASKGIFNLEDVQVIDLEIKKKYFLKSRTTVKIKNELLKQISFFRLNLTDSEYQLPKMDIVFLRNAIIYFDKPTKKSLINRLHNYIKDDGYLFIGHSESLVGLSDGFSLEGKTVYKRC